MNKSAITKRLIPAFGVVGVLGLSFITASTGIFGSLVGYGYGQGGCTAVPSDPMLIGDFNADGKADVAFAGTSVSCVALSTGSSFSPMDAWSAVPFYGTKATLVGDVNGDGKADLVAVNT